MILQGSVSFVMLFSDIHLNETSPLGVCFNTLNQRSKGNFVALSNQTGDCLVQTIW